MSSIYSNTLKSHRRSRGGGGDSNVAKANAKSSYPEISIDNATTTNINTVNRESFDSPPVTPSKAADVTAAFTTTTTTTTTKSTSKKQKQTTEIASNPGSNSSSSASSSGSNSSSSASSSGSTASTSDSTASTSFSTSSTSGSTASASQTAGFMHYFHYFSIVTLCIMLYVFYKRCDDLSLCLLNGLSCLVSECIPEKSSPCIQLLDDLKSYYYFPIIFILPIVHVFKYWSQIMAYGENIIIGSKNIWYGSEKARILADIEWTQYQVVLKERALRDAEQYKALVDRQIKEKPYKYKYKALVDGQIKEKPYTPRRAFGLTLAGTDQEINFIVKFLRKVLIRITSNEDQNEVKQAEDAADSARLEFELSKRNSDFYIKELSNFDMNNQENVTKTKLVTKDKDRNSKGKEEEMDSLIIHEGPHYRDEELVTENQIKRKDATALEGSCNYKNLGKYYPVKIQRSIRSFNLFDVMYTRDDVVCPYSITCALKAESDKLFVCIGTTDAVMIWETNVKDKNKDKDKDKDKVGTNKNNEAAEEFVNRNDINSIEYLGKIYSIDLGSSLADGFKMVIGCDAGYVCSVIRDPLTKAVKWNLIGQHGFHEGSRAVKIVKTGKNFVQDEVISGGVDGTIRVWCLKDNLNNRVIKKLFDKSLDTQGINYDDYDDDRAHNGHVNSICFSKDVEVSRSKPVIKTDIIVSVSSDKLIKIWNYGKKQIEVDNKTFEHGDLIQTLGGIEDGGHTDIITSVDISFDSARLCHIIVSCSHDSSIKIWNVPDRKSEFELLSTLKDPRNPTEKFNSVALSKAGDRAGQLIVSGSSCGGYGYVKLWDINTGTVIHTYIGRNRDGTLPAAHDNAVLSVAFSPDCSNVVSSGADFRVKNWSISEHPAIKEYLKNMPKPIRSSTSPSPKKRLSNFQKTGGNTI